jgi:signal transduction histidine kinase/ligand-binding sensor domain-containing protein
MLLAAALVVAAPSVMAANATTPPGTGWNYSPNSTESQVQLPGEMVQSFAQTPDGFLWVGTSEGLLKFDGAHFARFSRENTPAIRENSVFSLLTSRAGDLWIGTDGGGLLEMHEGNFRAFTAADGLSDGFIRALAEDHSGTLWVATDSGLYRRVGDKFERRDDRADMPANAFHAVIEDHLGRIWTGAASLYVIEKGHAREFPLGGSRHRVKSVLETEDGSIWAGTVSGLYRLKPGQSVFRLVPGVIGTVRTLCAFPQHQLWAGTIGHGIYRIPLTSPAGRPGAAPTRLTAPSPLTSNTVFSTFTDKDKNVWIGTQVGALRLSSSPVHVVLLPQAADSDFGTVSVDTDGSLWAASNHLVHLIGNKAESARLPGIGSAHVRNVMRTRDGVLWAGTDGSGVYLISPTATTRYTTAQGLANNFVRGMLDASDGSQWIITDSGVSHFKDGRFHNFDMANGLSHFSTRAIIEDRRGDIWIGTESGITHLRNDQPIHDLVTETLKGEKVWAEHEDSDGGLWFGTRSNGLYRFRNGAMSRFSVSDGLGTDAIFSILEDANRHFWISDPLGVMLLNRDELDAHATNGTQPLSMRFFGVGASDQPTRLYGGTAPAGAITPSGEVWYPTNRGLWRIRPAEFNSIALSHLGFEEIRVDGKPVMAAPSITLPAGHARLEVAFQPVMLGPQENLRFRHRMDGFDKDWISTNSDQRSAAYTNLPSGRYTFIVEAWLMDHPERVIRSSFVVVKQPYFYQTTWFVMLCVLGVGIAILIAYRIRMRRVRSRFAVVLRERSRLAREMHDTLIQGCASVSAMLEAAWKCDADDHESRMHMIDYANVQLRATMDEARQAVWDLRREEESPHNIAVCLAQMAERLNQEYGVSVIHSSEGESFPIGVRDMHELMMVAREALLNAIMHGHPNQISATVRFTLEGLEMSLADDGVGFDPCTALANGHFGLRGMKERVQMLGGELSIGSQLGQGTRIRVTVRRTGLSRMAEDSPVDALGPH